MRKSTGKAKIVAYMVWRNLYKEKAGRGGPVRQEKGDIEVFSNDFATVYFREDYATIAAPKRQNFGGFEKWKEVQKIFYKLQYICELTV